MIVLFFCFFQEPKSDVNDMQADESNIDADSDNETRTTNISMVTETKPTVNQGDFDLFFLEKIYILSFLRIVGFTSSCCCS
jgi:hypothetical protein